MEWSGGGVLGAVLRGAWLCEKDLASSDIIMLANSSRESLCWETAAYAVSLVVSHSEDRSVCQGVVAMK